MQVKKLLSDVMRLIGRSDAAEQNESSGTTSVELNRMRSAMLMCLNAVVDELSRGYFPLRTKQTLASETAEYSFSDFALPPYRILGVTAEGKKAEWSCTNTHLVCPHAEIEVEYEYIPPALTLNDEFDYPDSSVSSTLAAYGVAAEYLLICGDVESAEMWESRYRAEIERLVALRPVRGRITGRKWF